VILLSLLCPLVRMGSKVTIEEDSTESGIGFLIIQVMIITLKLGNVVTSKLVHHKTVDKSSTFMILEQGTLKTVILKYEIAEYNNPLDYMRMKRTQQKKLNTTKYYRRHQMGKRFI
jgi:hypothetical protein